MLPVQEMAFDVRLTPVAVPQATIAIVARTVEEAASLAGASHTRIGEIVQRAVEKFRPDLQGTPHVLPEHVSLPS